MTRTLSLLAALAVVTLPAAGQEHDMNMDHTDPVTSVTRVQDQYLAWVIRAAEQASEDDYAFRPVAGVRTLGQLFGHVANTTYMFCGLTGHTANPSESVDFEQASRSEIIAGLKAAQAFCGTTVAWAAAHHHDPAELFGSRGDITWVVGQHAAHTAEHYGNIVTYLRLRGMVPPSSQGG